MNWKIWAIGFLVTWIVVYLIRHFYHRWRRITFLDLIVIPSWIMLYMTMGLAFDLSYLPFILLGWLVLGLLLAYWLLTKGWRTHIFWHKYWQWSALIALLAEIATVIIAIILKK